MLLHTSICSILYNKVYPNHNGSTDAGKLCRLLLTKFTSICEAEDDYDGEPLNITEVIVVVEAEVNPRPVRTFRNMFTERRESVGPTNPNFCSTFVGVQSNNMEGYELESLEDRSDVIVNNDVLENSVEITSNNNSEVTNFVEISVDKSVEHGGVPVNNSEENNVTRLEISVPVNNRENNNTLPEISVDKNNDTLPDIEETGEVSTATNTVNNKQIDPKSMKVKELKLQLRKLGLSTTGNKPILVDRLTSGLKKKQSVKITFFDDNVTTMTDTC